MILDQEKFEQLLDSKRAAYSTAASNAFFAANNSASPCGMSEKATILYHLLQREVTYKEEEFTVEDKKEVTDFIACLEKQMNSVMSGELKPVDMTIEEISNLLRISDEEIASCCITQDDIFKMMEEVKNG